MHRSWQSLVAACAVALCCLATPARTHAQACDGWLHGSGYIGTENQVFHTVPWDPDGPGPQQELLVIAGHFRAVGAEPFRFLAAYDGERFLPIGDNFFGGVGAVHVHNGDLYAAGTHLDTIGDYHPGVFRWNTALLEWQRVGEAPTDGFVFSMVSMGNDLIVGGNFAGFGSLNANRVARWDGGEWQPVGEGLGGGPFGSPFDIVNALTIYEGDLHAGGYFYTTGNNVVVNNLARWDGTQWTNVGSGTSNGSNVYSLAADTNGLYIGGDFSSIGGQNIRNVARWNGATFNALGSGVNTWVYDLRARGNGEVIVGGVFGQAGGQTARRIALWSHATQSWSAFGPGFNNDVLVTADYQGRLFAGGRFDQTGLPGTLGTRGVSNIAEWDGTQWLPLIPEGATGTLSNLCVVYALGTYNNNPVAGGRFWHFNGVLSNGIAMKENGVWRPLDNGLNNGAAAPLIHAVAEWNGSLYVGGTFLKPHGLPSNTIGAARWDGAQWHALGSGGNHNSLAIAVYNNSVYYGGLFSSMSGGAGTAGIARWDGAAWNSVGGGIPGGQIWAITQFGTDLIVAGRFNAAGGVPAKNVARWDGTQWHAMGAGLGADPNVIVKALAVYNGQLYAGGEYIDFSGATPMRGVVRWNGSAWEEVGHTPNNLDTILALGVHDGKLFVGGTLNNTSLGPIIVNNLAKFDGANWDDMNGGTGDYVEAFLSMGDELWVGGAPYTNDGSESTSPCLARWSETADVYVDFQPLPVTAADGASVEFRVRAGGATDGVTYTWRRGSQIVIDGPAGASSGGATVTGATTPILHLLAIKPSDAGSYTCTLTNTCGSAASDGAALAVVPGPGCDHIDFNNDGLFPDTLDIDDFLTVFSGGPCSNDPSCGDIDFNNDGLFPDTLDIDSLLSVFSGGDCL